MIRIDYSRLVMSRAMNKAPYQCALSLRMEDSLKVLYIEAINPKMDQVTTDLYIQVPRENIQDLINELEKLK